MALSACVSNQPPKVATLIEMPQPTTETAATAKCVPLQFEQCTFEHCVVYISDGGTFDIQSDDGKKYRAPANLTPAGAAVLVYNPDTEHSLAVDMKTVCGGMAFPGGQTIAYKTIEAAQPGSFVLSNGWGRSIPLLTTTSMQ